MSAPLMLAEWKPEREPTAVNPGMGGIYFPASSNAVQFRSVKGDLGARAESEATSPALDRHTDRVDNQLVSQNTSASTDDSGMEGMAARIVDLLRGADDELGDALPDLVEGLSGFWNENPGTCLESIKMVLPSCPNSDKLALLTSLGIVLRDDPAPPARMMLIRLLKDPNDEATRLAATYALEYLDAKGAAVFLNDAAKTESAPYIAALQRRIVALHT